MVVSALMFFLAKTQFLFVFEFSSTGLTTEVCLSCVLGQVVPGGDSGDEIKHHRKILRDLPQDSHAPSYKITSGVRTRMTGAADFS